MDLVHDPESRALQRAQLRDAQTAWLEHYTRPDGSLPDHVTDWETFLIRAAQYIGFGFGSPYARARMMESLRATGVLPHWRDARFEEGWLESWWPWTLLPVNDRYLPDDPANRRDLTPTTQQEESHGQEPDPDPAA